MTCFEDCEPLTTEQIQVPAHTAQTCVEVCGGDTPQTVIHNVQVDSLPEPEDADLNAFYRTPDGNAYVVANNDGVFSWLPVGGEAELTAIYNALIKPTAPISKVLTGEFEGITLSQIKSGATYNHWFSGTLAHDKVTSNLAFLVATEDDFPSLSYYQGEVVSEFGLSVHGGTVSLGLIMVGKVSDLITALPVPIYEMDGTTVVEASDKIGIVYVDESNTMAEGNAIGGSLALILG